MNTASDYPSIKEHPPLHVPVLLEACMTTMQPQAGENYLDLTAGYGGHAQAFLEKTQEYERSCLVDRDEFALQHLTRFADKNVRLLHDDFVGASQRLITEQRTFDLILVDLGVSSPQLDRAERGFSFTKSGPLDMRMDRSSGISAAEFLHKISERELTQIIHDFGEEPLSIARRYAAAIVAAKPTTTDELANTILQHHVGGWQKIHPATRTFQAIRIALNDELGQVRALLPLIPALLAPGGRVGIISFHSLEDRLVKRYFAEQASAEYEAELEIVTKKPIHGTEDVHNPRSRSAKLRVAVKK